MQILITVGGKTIGKELSKAAGKIVIGVGCEVATFVISQKIINTIKKNKEAKNEETNTPDEMIVKAEESLGNS